MQTERLSVYAGSRLGLVSPLPGCDDAVEAAADRVQKRVVAERAADQLAPPQRGEGGVVHVRVEKIGEARRAVDERLHAHEPVVEGGQMRAHAPLGPKHKQPSPPPVTPKQ